MERLINFIVGVLFVVVSAALVLYIMFFAPLDTAHADAPVVQTYTNCASRTVSVVVNNTNGAYQNFHVRATVASKWTPLVQHTRYRNVTLAPGASKVFNVHIRRTFVQTGIYVEVDGVGLVDTSMLVPEC